MAETPSTMLALGTQMPAFRLADPSGKSISSDDFGDAPGFLVAFICNHCPYVKHIRSHFAQLAREYQAKGVAFVGINSNDVKEYPEDSPEMMAKEVKTIGYSFPYLYDERQEVEKAYQAACTPDFYLFDRERRLVYRGQMDDSRPGNKRPVTGADLRSALDAVLAAKPVSTDQKPSVGCNIKWKPGNQPNYFHR